MLLNLECGKLKCLGKLMCTSNVLEGEACLDAKHVGSKSIPMCLGHMMF